MATGGGGNDNGADAGDTTVNKLTCAVCLEKFRRPKLLPCFHTFCQGCLQGVAGSSPSLSCPSCRTIVLLPPGGVRDLQTNFYIEEDLNASAASPQQFLCDVCTEDTEATYTCLQCQQRFCLLCRKYHDSLRVTRGHTVMPLEPDDKGGCGSVQGLSQKPDEAAKVEMCPKHADQRLLLCCTKCQANICIQCKLTLHDGHPTEDLVDIRAKAKTSLQNRLENLTQQRQLTSHLILALKDRRTKLQQQQQESERGFQGRADTLHQWVNQSLDEAVTGVQSTAKQVDQVLLDQMEQLEKSDLALRALQDYVMRVLEGGKGADVVSLEAELTSTPVDSQMLKQVEKGLMITVPDFQVKHNPSVVSQQQLREFIGVLQPVQLVSVLQSSPEASGASPKGQHPPVTMSSGGTGKKRPPREFVYSNNPGSTVIAMCPISQDRLWVMYRLVGGAAVLMKLFDADGQVTAIVKNAQVCTDLISISDDTVLSWSYDKKTVQIISPDGELSGFTMAGPVGHLLSSAPRGNIYLRFARNDNSKLRQINFSKTGELDYKVTGDLCKTSSAWEKDCPGHVSSNSDCIAFVFEVRVDVYVVTCAKTLALFSAYYPATNAPIHVRFCQVGGREQLLVVTQGDNRVHVVDHTDGGILVSYLDTGPLTLDRPKRLATDFNRHVWVGCDGGKVVMVDL